MKWNDVELVDGKFYFVEVKRWSDDEPNNWVFAYKDDNGFITNHYVCAKITETDDSICCVFGDGHICFSTKIISLRPTTREDMDAFWSYLDRWDYKYSINTKKLRHVGCE